MIANVSARRRANAFAQALEDQAAEQPEESVEPTEHGRLLALANGLGELPKPEMDPEVKVVQRAQLVAAMEEMFAAGVRPRALRCPSSGQPAAAPIGPPRSGKCDHAPAGPRASQPVVSPSV